MFLCAVEAFRFLDGCLTVMALEIRLERLRSVAVSFLYSWKPKPPRAHNITFLFIFISPVQTRYELVQPFSQQDVQTYTSVLSDFLLGKWRTKPLLHFYEPDARKNEAAHCKKKMAFQK